MTKLETIIIILVILLTPGVAYGLYYHDYIIFISFVIIEFGLIWGLTKVLDWEDNKETNVWNKE